MCGLSDPQCWIRKRNAECGREIGFSFEKGVVAEDRIESKRFFCRNYDGSEDEVWLGCVSDCLIAIEECGPVGKESD